MISRFGGYVPVALIFLAFVLVICSGLAIRTAQKRMQRVGVRTPRAISVLSLFRQMDQYGKLARREGWSPILGWLPLPLQITAVVLFFRGIYLIKLYKAH